MGDMSGVYNAGNRRDRAAGVARRHGPSGRLGQIRTMSDDMQTAYDVVHRRVSQVADLLTQNLSNWLHAHSARPLALPG